MGSELRQTDTVDYSWASPDQTLEHADAATAGRARGLRVEHGRGDVLRGIEQFTGLRTLEVVVEAPLDLAPLGLLALPRLLTPLGLDCIVELDCTPA
ncbi:MAG: hypothetical protein WKF40_01925 [Thermoleophilaceae bacterium]